MALCWEIQFEYMCMYGVRFAMRYDACKSLVFARLFFTIEWVELTSFDERKKNVFYISASHFSHILAVILLYTHGCAGASALNTHAKLFASMRTFEFFMLVRKENVCAFYAEQRHKHFCPRFCHHCQCSLFSAWSLMYTNVYFFFSLSLSNVIFFRFFLRIRLHCVTPIAVIQWRWSGISKSENKNVAMTTTTKRSKRKCKSIYVQILKVLVLKKENTKNPERKKKKFKSICLFSSYFFLFSYIPLHWVENCFSICFRVV